MKKLNIIILFKAIALISIYTAEHLEQLTFGHNCEIVDYQPRPGADINGDEEYERLPSLIYMENWGLVINIDIKLISKDT